MRLQRLREKLIVESNQLQTDREQQEKEELTIAAKLYARGQTRSQALWSNDHGFEFSTEDVEAYLQGQRVSILTEKAMTAPGH
jgi:hypothetical protein